jgi:DNA-binding transcriptional MerR regulator
MAGGLTIDEADALSLRRRGRAPELLSEDDLLQIERDAPGGLTSRQIVDVFTSRGVRFSEATLRKYVQLGLLPHSVRVGQKGKHQGSRGFYPANVVRRVNLVKGMMAENLTIEEIQRSFLRFKDEIDGIEKSLRSLIGNFEREAARGPRLSDARRAELEQEIVDAKRAAGELVRRISTLETRLSDRGESSEAAIGGGSDLF